MVFQKESNTIITKNDKVKTENQVRKTKTPLNFPKTIIQNENISIEKKKVVPAKVNNTVVSRKEVNLTATESMTFINSKAPEIVTQKREFKMDWR